MANRRHSARNRNEASVGWGKEIGGVRLGLDTSSYHGPDPGPPVHHNLAKERRDGSECVGRRETGGRHAVGHGRGERLLGLLGGLLFGLRAVLVEVLAAPDPAAAESHPFNPRDRLVVGVARDVEGWLLVLVAGLGLVGVRDRLQRGDEGR